MYPPKILLLLLTFSAARGELPCIVLPKIAVVHSTAFLGAMRGTM